MSQTFDFRLAGRRLANRLMGWLPKPLIRHVLKSFWQQPRLQDELRFHVEPYRYDSAIPTALDTDRQKLQERRNLPGIPWNQAAFLDLLTTLEPFAAELTEIPLDRSPHSDFWWHNGGFEDFDATVLYAMVRKTKPRRLIEIGCGYSSKVIALARARNASEGAPFDFLQIEPYPSEELRQRPPGRLLVEKVQDVPLAEFTQLEPGDLLFIDTTHVVKAQSDCVYELLEIIPSLRPGVIVHVHDIFTPYDYPAEWLLDHLRPFNEQYALECLLSRSHGLEVILPLYALFREARDQLNRLRPGGSVRPGSIWLRTL